MTPGLFQGWLKILGNWCLMFGHAWKKHECEWIL
jgi:hypothetical protein